MTDNHTGQAAPTKGAASPRSETAGYLCPDRLKFPPLGQRYTAEQVIQRSIEAYVNGGRHGDPREPLAEFIANELRLHGWDLGR